MDIPFFANGSAYLRDLNSIGDVKVLHRYKMKIGLCGNIEPYLVRCKECIRNYSALPTITMVEIIMYLVNGTSYYTLNEFGAYKSLTSYKNFLSGWVQDMVLKKVPKSDKIILLGLVKHSYKYNDDPLMVWVLSHDNGTVVTAHCNCMAGLGEACSHVGTLLFMVEYLVRSNEAKSVTDLKSKWPVPSIQAIPFNTVNDILIKRKAVVDEQSLPQPIFTINDIIDDVVNAGLSPVLAKVIRPFCTKYVTNDIENNDYQPNTVYDLFCDATEDISQEELESVQHLNLAKHFEDSIDDMSHLQNLGRRISSTITEFEIEKIEQITRNELSQRKRPHWHAFRNGRATGSSFKSACVGDPKKPCKTTLKKICYSKDVDKLPKAMIYGIKNENVAMKRFIDEFVVVHENCVFTKCGLLISAKQPIFASTPDFLCSCSCCEDAVVEIKCPIRLCQSGTISEFSEDKNSYLFINSLDMFDLNRSHEYFYQCQIEMFTSNRKLCYFVVWTPREHIVIDIHFDEDFWLEASRKAEKYLHDAAHPELLGRYFSKNQENFFT